MSVESKTAPTSIVGKRNILDLIDSGNVLYIKTKNNEFLKVDYIEPFTNSEEFYVRAGGTNHIVTEVYLNPKNNLAKQDEIINCVLGIWESQYVCIMRILRHCAEVLHLQEGLEQSKATQDYDKTQKYKDCLDREFADLFVILDKYLRNNLKGSPCSKEDY